MSDARWLGTEEVARRCRVSRYTVIKWIDGGLIPGARLPGSRHRRVRAADVDRFLETHRDRVPGRLLVLSLGFDFEATGVMVSLVAQSACEAGILVERHRPDVVVVSLAAVGRLEAAQLAGAVRAIPGYDPLMLLATSIDHGPDLAGFDAAVGIPVQAGVVSGLYRDREGMRDGTVRSDAPALDGRGPGREQGALEITAGPQQGRPGDQRDGQQ